MGENDDEAACFGFRMYGVLEMWKTTGTDRIQVRSRTLSKCPAVKVASLADETDSEKRHKAVACVLGSGNMQIHDDTACVFPQYAMAMACLNYAPRIPNRIERF